MCYKTYSIICIINISIIYLIKQFNLNIMKATETINYKGHTIDILYDEYPEGPDQWANEDCFLVYDHGDFGVEVKGFDPTEIWEHIQETKKWFYDGYYVFPVYAYIHSGITLSMGRSGYPFTCPWDTSMRGFALVKRMKGWTYTRTKAEVVAKSVVEEWDDYCTGQVFGYVVDEGEDSCWGYIGDMGDCINDAKGIVDYMVKDAKQNHFSYLKDMIKNHVPLSHRKSLNLA